VPVIDVVPAFVIGTGVHAVADTHEPTTVMPFFAVYEKTFYYCFKLKLNIRRDFF
jgi:hypothetical protein